MNFKNILLIDDDVEDQEIFLSAAKEIWAQVNCIAISEAASALKKLKSREILPDIIFLDLNMPVMSGQQFLTEIKKDDSLKEIPVIIFTTSSHAPTKKITKNLGAYDFITKPNRYEELKKILEPF
ncbi:MAG: response regulator [Bacteroidetes bacterium]|nr:response regulator [Bacteroidota bacterium]